MSERELELRLAAHRHMLASLISRLPSDAVRAIECLGDGADAAEVGGAPAAVVGLYRDEINQVLADARRLACTGA